MANRKRPVRVKTYLTEEELKMVHKLMIMNHLSNFQMPKFFMVKVLRRFGIWLPYCL